MKMEKLKKDQRGFTLIELMIAIALAGLIGGGITAAIMQVLTINTRASNHMIAVRQVQQAGKEVSKDTLQAQNVTPGPACGFNPLTLIWIDWDGNNNVVTYTITADNELQRTHTINDIPQATAPPIVAEYIDSECTQTSFYPASGGTFILTVTATVGEQSETRVYEIEPRPG